ncbi:MAG: DNA methyltransferase [Gammaproteobacteria bacterium]|nr:DNA methyltransferase [Gammaproteobacteria bacterium]
MATGLMEAQERLDLRLAPAPKETASGFRGPCALEDDEFPFEVISDVAEAESWRKEINRPTYHVHKWWAQRLGTVFRAMVLGALSPSGTDVLDAFYRPVRLKGAVVFDPFMGSGTTVGEALKLGARVIGRDVNPVAHFLVRNALAEHDAESVLATFREIERDVSHEMRAFYRTELEDGTSADVLYFFWVKQVDCPECGSHVDLFSSRTFARHAYPKRHPEAQSVCPACGEVNACMYQAAEVICSHCTERFDPRTGPARGQYATCHECSHRFPIAKTIRAQNAPPAHRLYAKLVLTPDGKKIYAKATAADRRLYKKAVIALKHRTDAYPRVAIEPGYNTNQALGYNYRFWHEMFNERQLLCLSVLAERIRQIDDPALRQLFTCLFSGMLEFNNMFASYKGEGTGAVRHMFAHHILKPERVPLEANVWGTPKSSGSFMTLFKRRIGRTLEYARDPFELRRRRENGRVRTEKVYGLSEPLGYDIATELRFFEEGRRLYLSCGDSSRTDLRTGSVDAIVTDPPFFDNVHYSQLADFFHVWQRHILDRDEQASPPTTRTEVEVQHPDAGAFTERLCGVWMEANRVLSDEGVLAFTYHHSRSEGWRSVLEALMRAGFGISAAHPIKAEMSVAMPKRQAKEPIDLDIILVCRKRFQLKPARWDDCRWVTVRSKAAAQVQRLEGRGRALSRNDVRVIVMAQLILELSRLRGPDAALTILDASAARIEASIQALHETGERSFEEVDA